MKNPARCRPWLSLRGRRAGPGGMPVKKLSCAELLQVKGDGYLQRSASILDGKEAPLCVRLPGGEAACGAHKPG